MPAQIPANSAITPEALRQGWTPQRVGRRIIVLAETVSTNSEALEAANQPDVDGLVVLADYQSAGRGRAGREWVSPRGASVLCSVLLRVSDDAVPQRHDNVSGAVPRSGEQWMAGWLTLASAVAACDAIRLASDVAPSIKWPNDIRAGERKLGGILIESRPMIESEARARISTKVLTRAWVIGIGINCLQHAGHFPPELRGIATSLELESSAPIDRLRVARQLLRSLDRWLSEKSTDVLHAAWLKDAEPVGRRVCVRRDGHDYAGTSLAVDPAGGLIVQCDDGTQSWFDPLLTTLL